MHLLESITVCIKVFVLYKVHFGDIQLYGSVLTQEKLLT